MYMTQNKLQIRQNNQKYCSKCLSELDSDKGNRVIDVEDNEFCCWECRKDYYYEIRREMDSILSEF